MNYELYALNCLRLLGGGKVTPRNKTKLTTKSVTLAFGSLAYHGWLI